MKAIEVRGLNKSFSIGFIPQSTQILWDVEFSVTAGRITGFLGGNGAGKTTTMKCLLGLIFPDSGDLKIFGKSPLEKNTRKMVGFLPEKPNFYEHLTGKEFLRFCGQLCTTWKSQELNQQIDKLLKRVDLDFAKDKNLRNYSKGMLQKLGLAQALIHRPQLVILDEPMSGLDPDGRYYLSEMIKEVAKEGATVFFSSHLLPDVEKLCEDLVVLKSGRVLFQGEILQFMDSVHQKFVIRFIKEGSRQELQLDNAETMQQELRRITQQGLTVLEVMPLRKSLEDVFVEKALKGRL